MKKNEIRLLHLVKSLQIGGVEKSTIIYSNELVVKIDFVGIFGFKGKFDNYSLLTPKVKRFIPGHSPQDKLFFFETAKFLIEVIINNNITHLHYHQRTFIPLILIIKLIYPKVKIIYSHQNIFNDYLNKLIIADKIIALTDAAKDDLPKRLRDITYVIPHGTIIPDKYKKITKGKAPNTFGFVGRFVKWKGIKELVLDFNKILHKNPKIKLLLIGDGPLKPEIINIVFELNLQKNITILEPIYNSQIIYSLFDVLILPSTSLEGFGIVLIEAMGFGVPSIVRALPTYNNIIINNFNGIVNNNISEAIIELSSSPELYSRLSKNSRTFSKKFNIHNIVEEYINKIYCH